MIISEISTLIDTYSNALQKMVNNIKPSDLKIDNISETLFPTLHSMVKEVSVIGEYQSCPILAKKYTVHDTRRRAIVEESVCSNYEDSLKVAGKHYMVHIRFYFKHPRKV